MGPEPVEVVETHSAVVLLAGDRAYKWKKPVDFGFLDFREASQRADACRRELELNRRLAPDVYLDVATLSASDGARMEDVLVMRRLPGERRLAHLVATGAPVTTCLREVARAMADLHARTTTPEAAEVATATVVRGHWEENFGTLRKFADQVVAASEIDQVGQLARSYLDGREALFTDRLPLACDGHGDLLADDIFCLDDGPRIIDCLDFADRYRMGDPLLDLAFLAMDLERLGRSDLSDSFLDWSREFSGDHPPRTLVHHFIAYRAHVRAKVACLRTEQGDDAARDEAQLLHRLCLDHLRAGQVALVLVGGLPGAGKSTVARRVADAQGWALLSSDEVRKDLLGVEREERAPEEAYTPEARTTVYEELLARAEHLLAHGQPVVADASWLEPDWREAAARVARGTHAESVALRCEAPRPVLHERVTRRLAGGADASDADASVLDRLAARAGPWPEAHVVETDRDPDEAARTAVALVRSALGV